MLNVLWTVVAVNGARKAVSNTVLEYQPGTCFSQAINLLPANVQIREIQVFLESVLEEKAQRKRCSQVVKSLLQAEFLRVSSADPPGISDHLCGRCG